VHLVGVIIRIHPDARSSERQSLIFPFRNNVENVMLCYVMLCYVTLCYVTLRYVMLRYVTLCYVTLCYVMLCYFSDALLHEILFAVRCFHFALNILVTSLLLFTCLCICTLIYMILHFI